MDSQTYKVIELDQYGGKLKVAEREIPTLNNGQVLVKIISATIHPADMVFLYGYYGVKKPDIFPLVPGFEGSGIVTKVADDASIFLLNKRVALFSNSNKTGNFHGTWAQYAVFNADEIVPFEEEISFEKLNFFFINPFTAVGFLDTLKKRNCNAVVQNAANGTLGRMFMKLCLREGINIINLVRKDEHLQDLITIGAQHVINTSKAGWEQDLEKLATEINATVAFDCVGGEMTSKILGAMPSESTLFHYGNLEGKSLSNFNTSDFINHEKYLTGWWLTHWIRRLNKEKYNYWLSYVKTLFLEKESILGTKLSKVFLLDDVNNAIEYYGKNMTEGKVIIHPWD